MTSNDYLNNPLIPRGFYNVKCTAVETMNCCYIIHLHIIPFEKYGKASNVVLHVTLRESMNTNHIHELFCHTFGIVKSYEEAVGRFGCILVDTSEYQGKKYSGVHFILQSEFARKQAKTLERSDREGEISWV